jgi:hypothetical protein
VAKTSTTTRRASKNELRRSWLLAVFVHFAEAPFDQLGERCDQFLSVGARSFQFQLRTVASAEREQIKNALAVDDLIPFLNLHFALKRHGHLHEEVGRPRMEALRVNHHHQSFS